MGKGGAGSASWLPLRHTKPPLGHETPFSLQIFFIPWDDHVNTETSAELLNYTKRGSRATQGAAVPPALGC